MKTFIACEEGIGINNDESYTLSMPRFKFENFMWHIKCQQGKKDNQLLENIARKSLMLAMENNPIWNWSCEKALKDLP